MPDNGVRRAHHPQHKARLADLGGVPAPMLPADFAKQVADETEK